MNHIVFGQSQLSGLWNAMNHIVLDQLHLEEVHLFHPVFRGKQPTSEVGRNYESQKSGRAGKTNHKGRFYRTPRLERARDLCDSLFLGVVLMAI